MTIESASTPVDFVLKPIGDGKKSIGNASKPIVCFALLFFMFELADGGTLFLDEIGEISRRVQAKLLRAVECGEIQKLGGGVPICVDVRLIAATNRKLDKAVEAWMMRT
jgi:hypothetical protein